MKFETRKNLGTCNLCGKTKKLCKAHILPQLFYRQVKLKQADKLDILKYNAKYEKTTHSGIYDPNILCAECDNSFSKYEQYTKQFLYLTNWNNYQKTDAKKPYYLIPAKDINYLYLKLFIVSFLWKTSVSSEDGCQHIDLGKKWNDYAKKLLLNPKLDDPENFSFCFLKMKAPDEKLLNFIIPLCQTPKHEQTNFYIANLPAYVVVIKVDSRKTPYPFSKCIVKPEEDLMVFSDNFENSPEMKLLDILFTNRKQNRERKQGG
jgi:hypothetical protein